MKGGPTKVRFCPQSISRISVLLPGIRTIMAVQFNLCPAYFAAHSQSVWQGTACLILLSFQICTHCAQAVGAGNLQELPLIFQRCIIFMLVPSDEHTANMAEQMHMQGIAHSCNPQPAILMFAAYARPLITEITFQAGSVQSECMHTRTRQQARCAAILICEHLASPTHGC